MKKVGFIVAALVLMGLVGGVVGAKLAGGEKKSILQKVADSVEEKSTLDVKTIEEILQPAGDLITQRYYYTDMDTFENFSDDILVNSYDKEYKVYVYTFMKGDLMYSFVSPDSSGDFEFYYITKAE